MTKKLDFLKINSLALVQAENVVSHYAPNGKLESREWVACNPSRNDNSARSFSVNVDTGLWADFSTNDKGALFKARHNYNALRSIEQVLRNGFI